MSDTILYDVRRAYVWPVESDNSEENPPTYGSRVRVPGIRTVELSPEYESNQLKGDGRVIDSRTILAGLSLSFGYGKLAPPVLAVLDGGTAVTADGVTEYRRTATDRIPYFGFAAEVAEVDANTGSALLAVFYAKIEDGTLFGSETDAYGQPEFTANAQPTESGLMWKARYAETGEAIPEDLAALAADLTAA